MIPFTAIVQHFYPTPRREYLHEIVDSIRLAEPQEVIIWDNTNQLEMDHVTVIRSTRNTLMGRYAAALTAKTEYLYVQDDDLVVEPETIRRMLSTVQQEDCVAGAFGVIFSGRDPERPYTDGIRTNGNCDMVLGRSFAFHKRHILPFLKSVFEHGEPGRCDDLALSMVNRCVALEFPRYQNLDEMGLGLSHEKEHFPERDAFVVARVR